MQVESYLGELFKTYLHYTMLIFIIIILFYYFKLITYYIDAWIDNSLPQYTSLTHRHTQLLPMSLMFFVVLFFTQIKIVFQPIFNICHR